MLSGSGRWRGAAVLALASIAAAGCGSLLEGVGDLSRSVVHGDRSAQSTDTTVPAEGPGFRLAGVTAMTWANDGIGDATAGLDREALISAVWARGDGVNRFVQASRREIATALPGIEFPQLLPGATTHVSSQLVYDELTAGLDVATAAAFGMWVDEPYALPRTEAQLAVLRVGFRTAFDPDPGEFLSFQVSEGRELTWTKGDYVYQLFCRTGVSEPACFAIAESTFFLSAMLEYAGSA